MSPSYRELDATQIIATLERLCFRIEERFPGAGLAGVGRELFSLSRECARDADSLGRPNWTIRAGVGVVIALMVTGVAFAVYGAIQRLVAPAHVSGIAEFVQGIEAAVNDAVFLALAIFFLVTIETRIKRSAALKRIHQLRSIAHIVDMHQLTKDPERLMIPQDDTASSPHRPMTRLQIGRYLDYCSELLSLTGKIGALFVQHFDDSVVLQAVNEIEDLTTGLSRKIWQKITLLDRPGT
ncbi:MAG: hypothetical protein ABIT38_18760 [Gemmatimonadaceae bacterium]